MKKRTDLRHLAICSVDPPGCTDIDDALHCRPLLNGNIEVEFSPCTSLVVVLCSFLCSSFTSDPDDITGGSAHCGCDSFRTAWNGHGPRSRTSGHNSLLGGSGLAALSIGGSKIVCLLATHLNNLFTWLYLFPAYRHVAWLAERQSLLSAWRRGALSVFIHLGNDA